METWEKVTTRSRVSIYRTIDPMEIIAAIDLKLDQDDRHTHVWKKKKTLCPVTVFVDSQVSDRCPWATCLFFFSPAVPPFVRLSFFSCLYAANSGHLWAFEVGFG